MHYVMNYVMHHLTVSHAAVRRRRCNAPCHALCNASSHGITCGSADEALQKVATEKRRERTLRPAPHASA